MLDYILPASAGSIAKTSYVNMNNKMNPPSREEQPAETPDTSAVRVAPNTRITLSVDEERSLVRAWQKDKDIRARERLVTAHLSICHGLARKLDRTGTHVDDLVQEGVLAMMMVADKFDLSRDNRFSTYAAWWVRARMQDFLTGGGGAPMGMTGTPRKLAILSQGARIKAYKEMMAAGREPDEQALNLLTAEILKVKPKQICEYHQVRQSLSLNLPVSHSEPGGLELIDRVQSEDDGPEASMIAGETEASVHFLATEMLNALTPREAEVIRRRMLYETRRETLGDIAADLGITRERVRQIQVTAIEKMVQFIEKQPGHIEKLSLINEGYTRIMHLRKTANKARRAQ